MQPSGGGGKSLEFKLEALLKLGGHAVTWVRQAVRLGGIFYKGGSKDFAFSGDFSLGRKASVVRGDPQFEIQIILRLDVIGGGFEIYPAGTDI